MSQFDMVLTDAGAALLAAAASGTAIVFTRIAIGDGSLTSTPPEELTALISETMSLDIDSASYAANTASIKAHFDNSGLTEAMYFREIGLFVQDPDDAEAEILYTYGNAGVNADYIPAGTGNEPMSEVLTIRASIENAVNVSTTIQAYGDFPVGGIIMWSGLVSDIPNGWALCDGYNGTPNLINRFVYGSGDDLHCGVTGGSANKTLSVNEMPNHTHAIPTEHSGGQAFANYAILGNNSNPSEVWYPVSTMAAGYGQSFSILPPYLSLAFIMKI